jgi:O-antigen ligase
MMLADHPGGVGPNNFAVTANAGGYYDRSGGVSKFGRESNVHNLYLLVWAETGPLGLASFILMLAAPLVMALRYGPFGRWQAGDPQRDILIGASVTLMIVYIHSTEEWVPIIAELQYLLAIMFGLIAGLTAEERIAKRVRHRLPASSQNLLRGGSP